MLSRIVAYSLKNKLMVMAVVVAVIIAGINALLNINLNAVPDITNNQVQIVTSSPTLASKEVEQYITTPVEMAMSNLPEVEEVRSISRYGLSVVTIVFNENLEILTARQYVKEQLDIVRGDIDPSIGKPELMPITTGLGEVYQYVLSVDEKYKDRYDLMELRTIHDWIVKRQLAGIEGVIEISSFGGLLKQYEVAVHPEKMELFQLDFNSIEEALVNNNEGVGGSYIEHENNAFYLRSDGRINSLSDIEDILVTTTDDGPILIKDIAEVRFGAPKRFGAMTIDGKGEVVGGITLMLKDASSSKTINNIHERIDMVQKSLPPGLSIYPYLDRSVLIGKTIKTVTTNLIEGGLIVVFVLVLFLGNIRAGLIVASVIPLAMLFTFIMMQLFGVSANLMSLGAIDFGIVVDGAVIVVEGVLHAIMLGHVGKTLKGKDISSIINTSTKHIYKSAAFGVLIILVVFVPIMTLKGIEGKMFKPMAMTISFAVFGALLLSLTYVPVMVSLVLGGKYSEKKNLSDKLVERLQNWYKPVLNSALKLPVLVIAFSLMLLGITGVVFSNMGGEFIPTLEEGDLAMQLSVPPGSSLETSIRKTTEAEKILKDNFPEVKHVVSKIGTAEVPTDPMAIEDADVMIILKERDEWTSASNREDLIALMKDKLESMDSASFEFTQPIQLRFNELMTGAKSDIVIKISGENTDSLKRIADRISARIINVDGAGDVKVEQTDGLPQLNIKILRDRLNIYSVDVREVNNLIKTAYAGSEAGVVYEEERKFDIMMRIDQRSMRTINLGQLQVKNRHGEMISLGQLVKLEYQTAPMQISREDAKRMIKIGVNVRNRDVSSLVEEMRGIIDSEIKLPPGYTIYYGGQFENMQNAMDRLIIVVPVALLLIFILLYSAFNSLTKAGIIFFAVPLSAIGGVFALYARGLPFSISAAIGFIALFGVAVLNGLVMISEFNRLQEESNLSLKELIVRGASTRLRPVLMTAMVASLGFLPMALSESNGAEVQRPLATVVIGGLISATFLTLVVLPALYYLINRGKRMGKTTVLTVLMLGAVQSFAQTDSNKVYSYAELLHVSTKFGLQIEENKKTIQVLEMEARQKVNVSPMDVGFQYGQMNDAQQDIYVEADQNLSDFWKHKHLRNYAKVNTEVYREKQQLDGKMNTFALNREFFAYRMSIDIIALYDRVDSVMSTIERSVNSKYIHGGMTKIDYEMFNNAIATIRNAKQSWYNNAVIAKQNVCELTGINFSDSIDVSQIPQFNNPSFDTSNNWYSSYYMRQESLLDAQRKLIKAQYNPDISLGYFHQSFNRRFNFNGIKLGVIVPIFNQGKHVALEKVEAERNLVTAQKAILDKQWFNRYESNLDKLKSIESFLENNEEKRGDISAQLGEVELLTSSGELSMLELHTYVQSSIETHTIYIIKENEKLQIKIENELIKSK